MANDLNKVFLIGRLTRDPELRSTASGSYLCRFSLASNRAYYKKDSEELQEEVGFFDCVSWGKQAEVISKYLKKGRRVGVDGHLRWSQWENQEGKKQSKVEITVENFQFLDPKSNMESPQQNIQEGSQEAQPTPTEMNKELDAINDDDIPF